jgi:hypothetical protein
VTGPDERGPELLSSGRRGSTQPRWHVVAVRPGERGPEGSSGRVGWGSAQPGRHVAAVRPDERGPEGSSRRVGWGSAQPGRHVAAVRPGGSQSHCSAAWVIPRTMPPKTMPWKAAMAHQ